MLSEKVLSQIEKLNRVFSDKGFYLKEDLDELFETAENLATKIEKIKFNKIEIFTVPETGSIGFTLDDVQVEFFLENGEDEEGEWYEATAEITYFDGED